MQQIKAAEDILSLTRILKETWLFGKLQTIGTSEAETRAQAAAAKVADGLRKLGSVTSPDIRKTSGVDRESSGVNIDAAEGRAEGESGTLRNEDKNGGGERMT